MTTTITMALASLAGCGAEEPFDLTVDEQRMSSPAIAYTLALHGAPPEGVEELAVQADCGGTGIFETVPGAVLSEAHPVVRLVRGPAEVLPTDLEGLEAQADEALAAADETSAQIEELLAVYPIEECVAYADCEAQLEGLLSDMGASLTEAEAALGALVAGVTSPTVDPVVTECSFNLISLGRVLFDGAPRPTRVVQGYEDWTQAVEINGDPCFGRTPVQCYRERIERWKKRACGEIDAQGHPVEPPPLDQLEQPFRDICMAIRNGWATFPDTTCERLGGTKAGETSRQPHPADPADLPDGMHPDGTGSSVRFDWRSMLQDGCSYSVFVHEMTHVVDNGEEPDPDWQTKEEMTALLQQVQDARMQRDAAEKAGNVALALTLTNLIDGYLKALDALDGKTSSTADVDARLATECRAYLNEMTFSAQVTDPIPDDARDDEKKKLQDQKKEWQKSQPMAFLLGIDHVLNRDYRNRPPSPEGKAATCACLNEMRAWADETVAEGDTRPIWECIKREIFLSDLLGPDAGAKQIETAEKRFDRLETELGCP